MFFVEEKLEERIKQLGALKYINRKKITEWKLKEDLTKQEKYPPNVEENWSEIKAGDIWEGRDRYFWLLNNVYIPDDSQYGEHILIFDFGNSVTGNTSGFEALLFINGEPYQGVDGNHIEVLLDDKYKGKNIDVALKLWGGLEGGGAAGDIMHEFKCADIAILSSDTEDLYYTSSAMLDTVQILDDKSPERYQLLNILEKGFKKIDWSYPLSEEYFKTVKLAKKYINEELDKIEKNSPINVTAVGHTHIDVAWLWRLKHTREKAVRSFSTVLQLMKRYPEYIFLQTQPQIYEYIKEDYPEIYKKIKEKIADGQWEIDGAMWLEADANIPSGESLVRQILFGSRFIKQEFNKDVNYLWLPDVFGYSWALPQILKKSGIDMFMTTKISWNQFNRMPNDTFYWKGIDGSEVLTHFITTPSIDEDIGPYFYTYNGEIKPKTVKGIYDGYQDKDINNDLLLAYGYGDGGGGVTREMLENIKRIDKIPGLPNIKTGKAKEYFEKLKKTFQETDNYVHTWDGELYLEYHRGTYTSQARVKKLNRKLELAHREVEILYSWLLKKQGKTYPAEDINNGWKIILRNQFHDIIPGTSIKEVYEDAEKEYAEVFSGIKELKNNFVNVLSTDDDTWTVFNTAGWTRSEAVNILTHDLKDGYFIDDENNELRTVKTDNGYSVYMKSIPPLGNRTIKFIEKSTTEDGNPFVITEKGVDSPYYEINWNDEGHLIKLFDKESNRNVLKENGLGNVFQLFEDKPMNWDAWDIDIFYNQKKKILKANKIKVTEMNKLFIKIQFDYKIGKSELIQEMILYKDSKRIDFNTKVDWQERQQLLKVAFEVGIRATEATYDIQYGNVKRPTHWNTSWDMARFETVGHQWADLSETNYGVALLNDSKYGYDIKDNTMRLSLLKGPIYPDPEADLGKHEFTYSILPHRGDFLEGKVVEEAWSLNSPLTAFEGTFPQQNKFIEIKSESSVLIDAIKKSEDDDSLIIRLHDHTGGRRKITLEPQFNYNEWKETDLMEKDIDHSLPSNTEDITFELEPYEIKTIRIR